LIDLLSKLITAIKKSNQHVFSYKDLLQIVKEERYTWLLPVKIPLKYLVDLVLSSNFLKKIECIPYGIPVINYLYENPSPLELAVSIKPKSYFSHFTAMYINNLTDQISKKIYINYEQKKKNYPKDNQLKQENIDFVFSGKPRLCGEHRILKYNDYQIIPLNGMNTEKLGVIQLYTNELNREVRVTNLERTLIDIVVRPQYSGGIHQMLEAYKKAIDKVSINEICTMLRKLNYIYPYHQNIGFLLEKAGYPKLERLEQLKKFGINYKFYLTYEMKETEFSNKWQIYYPKGF
jgi:predicted transcriptional regulator of viral defense system